MLRGQHEHYRVGGERHQVNLRGELGASEVGGRYWLFGGQYLGIARRTLVPLDQYDILIVAHVAGSLRISVRDRGGETPSSTAPTLPRQMSEGGRGLPIIAALTTDWGFFSFGDGKTVWAAIGGPNGSTVGGRAVPISPPGPQRPPGAM
ncbi:hypothetical protein DLJ59_13510 [Micromonospora inaquosa]|uniref:Histidine kinase/HSP90-like ATPase domain-containing protein n=1 Tax=Micromonospora inaquosa TaxID=2203716 RepID=A0A3N9WQ68_9ACTN|nr:hypothetical protein DLJ59_13510 [Micromonospora inaquosa]